MLSIASFEGTVNDFPSESDTPIYTVWTCFKNFSFDVAVQKVQHKILGENSKFQKKICVLIFLFFWNETNNKISNAGKIKFLCRSRVIDLRRLSP